jgi:PAS domain S-box-containing protein
MNMSPSVESLDLERQIESLRQQLQDAEELRHAISQGEVDAFVVGPTEDSKRVLMLSGAYARYRQLVEEMQQGAVTISRTGEILFANHAFAAMVGLAPADVFRTPLGRYLSPGESGAAAALLQPNARSAEVKATLQGAGGKAQPVRISLVTANEDFVTLLFTERDAHEDEAGATVDAIRNGAVDALVVGGEQVVMLDSAQRFYQAAVDRMQQGVVIVGAQGEVAYANQRMASLLGVQRERLAGASLAGLAHHADQAKLASLLAARQGAAAQQSEIRLRRANHEYVTTLVTVTAMADGQKMCLVTDLSLQKRHEATDERTRKFLGMMAHEFRNILAPIRTSVDFLKRHEGVDAEARKMVEIIDRQSARLLSLVEDLRRINPRE